ncbi:MAG: bifunctional phosphoribosylaminoimidazolecarboxamide formyltransferase/IMP cyclohydrolase [Chloroflexi bacterium]|nr:bifunctional phosphoribosylaminoimidazolecarboxamide formyltransferase/IMP cyclohydrolase [Chloroflexota bacterium]
MRAILSVSDKTGLVDFARGLIDLKFEIYSTGGTKKALTDAGLPVHSVSDITGFPEILDGRVKTLHPGVHGGILARRDLPAHLAELEKNRIGLIDLVAVNLYPFVQTVAKAGVTVEEALENIDIGGPTMIRASAKNFPHVLVVVDPADYPSVLAQLRQGKVGMEARQHLALKAFQHTALYDTAISQYLRRDHEAFPPDMTVAMKKRFDLRYGENPHQKAAFYGEQVVGGGGSASVTSAVQLGGKELSYNNIIDADAAWNAATDFFAPTAVVVKHTNPCGLSSHDSLAEAYRRAFSGDPISAFGGIVAFNRTVDLATAEAMKDVFYEIVIAPGYDDDALEVLRKKKDMRILACGEAPAGAASWAASLDYRRVKGGFLVQTPDALPEGSVHLRTVTRRAPTEAELRDLLFGWRAVKHVKSNAILIVKDATVLGMGAGQPNRVTSVHLALRRAEDKARGAVVASDAFFPFADGVELAAQGGVTAIIEPGGSLRDKEAIEMADKYNVAMVFTGVRHFKH